MRAFCILALFGLLSACQQPDTQPPAIPSNLTATSGESKVALSWKANLEEDLKGYRISWSDAAGEPKRTFVPAPALSTELAPLDHNTHFFISISAEDKNGNRSPESSPVVVKPLKPGNIPDPNAPLPAKPHSLVATPGDGSVTLRWVFKPDKELAGYELFINDQPRTLPLSAISEKSGVQNTVISQLNNQTAYTMSLQARYADNTTSPPSDKVSVTPVKISLVPIILTVELENNQATFQVRQGIGAKILLIKGKNLVQVKASLDGLAIEVVEQTETQLRLRFSVGHGAAIGPRKLILQNSEGKVEYPSAIEVSPIYALANDQLASDTAGLGTPNRPFRTLTKAMSVALAGDSVLLGPGEFAKGETWPVPLRPEVTIRSQAKNTAQLVGPGIISKVSAIEYDPSKQPIPASGLIRVDGLAIRNFGTAISLNAKSTTSDTLPIKASLENLDLRQNDIGVYARSLLAISLSNSTLLGHSSISLWVYAIKQLAVIGVHLEANRGRFAVAISECESAVVGPMVIRGNLLSGLVLHNSNVQLSQTQIEGNQASGIEVWGKDKKINLKSVSILNNSFSGLLISDHNSLTFDAVTIGGGPSYQILDTRPANSGFLNMIGVNIPGADLPRIATAGPVANLYLILRTGNYIQFKP